MAKGNGDTRVSKWRSFSAPLSDDLYYANGARQNFIDLPDDKKKEVREVRKRIEREMKSSLVGKTIEMQLGNGEQPLTVEFTNRGIEHFCNDAMISMSGKYFSENSMKNIDSILKQAKYMPPAVATRPGEHRADGRVKWFYYEDGTGRGVYFGVVYNRMINKNEFYTVTENNPHKKK